RIALSPCPYSCPRGWNCVATTGSYGPKAVCYPHTRVNRPQSSPCQRPQALERLKRYDPQSKKLAYMRSIRHCSAYTPVCSRYTVGPQYLPEACSGGKGVWFLEKEYWLSS